MAGARGAGWAAGRAAGGVPRRGARVNREKGWRGEGRVRNARRGVCVRWASKGEWEGTRAK